MRDNYFYKLIKYIKNAYHIEEKINKLKNGRVNPSYRTGNVVLPLLCGFLLRIQSLNELNCMLKENEFKKLFTKGTKSPLIDTIRDTLKSSPYLCVNSHRSNFMWQRLPWDLESAAGLLYVHDIHPY